MVEAIRCFREVEKAIQEEENDAGLSPDLKSLFLTKYKQCAASVSQKEKKNIEDFCKVPVAHSDILQRV